LLLYDRVNMYDYLDAASLRCVNGLSFLITFLKQNKGFNRNYAVNVWNKMVIFDYPKRTCWFSLCSLNVVSLEALHFGAVCQHLCSCLAFKHFACFWCRPRDDTRNTPSLVQWPKTLSGFRSLFVTSCLLFVGRLHCLRLRGMVNVLTLRAFVSHAKLWISWRRLPFQCCAVPFHITHLSALTTCLRS